MSSHARASVASDFNDLIPGPAFDICPRNRPALICRRRIGSCHLAYIVPALRAGDLDADPFPDPRSARFRYPARILPIVHVARGRTAALVRSFRFDLSGRMPRKLHHRSRGLLAVLQQKMAIACRLCGRSPSPRSRPPLGAETRHRAGAYPGRRCGVRPTGNAAALYLPAVSINIFGNLEQTLPSAQEYLRWEIKFLLLGWRLPLPGSFESSPKSPSMFRVTPCSVRLRFSSFLFYS